MELDDILENLPEELLPVVELEGNQNCADCGVENPEWASLSFSVIICLECAGLHRSLGVHISPVRSLTMDTWTDKMIHKLSRGGNKRFREYLSYLSLLKGIDVKTIASTYTYPQVLYYREILNAEIEDRDAIPYDEDYYTELAAKYSSTNAKEKKMAPEWVPDSTTNECMLCFTPFTMTRRRHHCRRCGICVCKYCAPEKNTRPIIEWGMHTPVRHCKKCYMSPSLSWE